MFGVIGSVSPDPLALNLASIILLDIDSNNSPAQTVKILQDPSYVLTILYSIGCYEYEDNYIISVNTEFTVDGLIMFPPNGDGVNDLVTIYGRGIKNLKSIPVEEN